MELSAAARRDSSVPMTRAPAATDLRPYLAVAACVGMWGFSGILVKSVDLDPLVASFYRLWFGVPVLWGVALLQGRGRVRLSWQWLRLCAVGGLLFGVHQVFFFSALRATRVANVTIIAALQPALVVFVAARMFAEPVPWRAVPFLGVAFAGVAMVVVATQGRPGVAPYGDALAIANLISFTAYFLATKRIRNHLDAWAYVKGMTTVAALFMSAVLPLSGQCLAAPSAGDAAALLAIAAIPGAVGHTLMSWAHPLLSAFTISSMILVVPVIASLAAVWLLDEPLYRGQILGGAVALAAIGVILRETAAAAARDRRATAAARQEAIKS
jgi:drug/metabolite transporter (DMT)-like permease